ncbi:signal peptidase I [Streptomyces sp. NPDC001941]|uniref:signal peptidase I n=1 Tax=Streptomyces sp. NPDC001941 TaxID=3154659 RepID=UPI00332C1D79
MTGKTTAGGSRLGGVLSGVAVALGCVLFLGGFAWGAVLYKPYTVPTDSMTPTVGAGDRVLAQRIDGADVRRGDVVIFKDPAWGDLPMVKRVVGVGGDKVACCDAGGRLSIDGKVVQEPYVRAPAASPIGFTATVPKGQIFLLGDERTGSLDSRSHLQDAGHGSVPLSAVSGRVDAVVWPLGSMVDRPAAFEGMPGGVSSPGPVTLVAWTVVAGAVLILGGAAYGPLAKRRGRRTRAREAVAHG